MHVASQLLHACVFSLVLGREIFPVDPGPRGKSLIIFFPRMMLRGARILWWLIVAVVALTLVMVSYHSVGVSAQPSLKGIIYLSRYIPVSIPNERMPLSPICVLWYRD